MGRSGVGGRTGSTADDSFDHFLAVSLAVGEDYKLQLTIDECLGIGYMSKCIG